MARSDRVALARALPHNASGRELLAAARAGDEAAWAALVRRYSGAVRGALRGFRLNAADEEDLTQITWMRLFEHGASVRTPDALPGWLATTARREAMRRQSAAIREVPTDPGDWPESSAFEDPAAELLLEERRSALRRALPALPPRQRALAELLVREPEPSYAELCAALDMPVGSIGPTRGRCLERLRRHPALAALDGAA